MTMNTMNDNNGSNNKNSKHELRTCWVPDTVLRALRDLNHLILSLSLLYRQIN